MHIVTVRTELFLNVILRWSPGSHFDHEWGSGNPRKYIYKMKPKGFHDWMGRLSSATTPQRPQTLNLSHFLFLRDLMAS
jgi:hypothetical protein